ncbi:MAG TPA: hypothetical protein VFQ91_11840 [Bryobacteraceae bacterium]|nr:hypothetical protein [Bryobacteraceae bacterium]
MVARLLSVPVAAYIRIHQDRFLQAGQPICPSSRGAVRNHFSPGLLDTVRIVEADPLPVAHPPFANLGRRFGWSYPGIEQTAAITFGPTIAARQPMDNSLLFHELVHVVQYRLLGIAEFARLYVRGLLRTRSYHAIPLEACAFELEARFQFHREPFDVEAEVTRWMHEKRF